MNADKFMKGCLVLIVLLLVTILARPIFGVKKVYATGRGIEYKVVEVMPGPYPGNPSKTKLEELLNKHGKDGWELIDHDAIIVTVNGKIYSALVFKK